MIITTKEEFDILLNSLFEEKPNKLRIATYGYRDIPEIQPKIKKVKDCQLLIGLSPLRECVTNCVNCKIMHNLKMTKYERIKSILKEKVAFKESMHTKIYYFEFDKRRIAILGSRNLTGSNWSEINVVIEDEKSIENILTEFDLLWKDKVDINTNDLLDYEKIISNIKKHKSKNTFLESVYTFYSKHGAMTDKQTTCCIRAINKIEDKDISYDLTIDKEKSKFRTAYDNFVDKF